MPDFMKPFSGMVPERKMTLAELARALRLNIAAEQEAAFLYEAHADATDHPLAKKVLHDVADEERVHIGEFQRLLSILLEDEEKFLRQGAEEVDEIAEELRGGGSGGEGSGPGQRIPTVGSLKE
ncbi:MAG: ferritin family protein [bacterium]